VLPAANRLRRSGDFRATVRSGRRVPGRRLVLHLRYTGDETPPLIGFVTGRAVGGAVSRNLVRRRLRHLMRSRAGRLPAGAQLVVRALPAAQTADSRGLGAELDRLLDRAGVTGSRR
jgi:ribonuclease P protein component